MDENNITWQQTAWHGTVTIKQLSQEINLDILLFLLIVYSQCQYLLVSCQLQNVISTLGRNLLQY